MFWTTLTESRALTGVATAVLMWAALCCGLKRILVIDWWLQRVPEIIVPSHWRRQAVPLAIVPIPDPDLPARFRLGNFFTAYRIHRTTFMTGRSILGKQQS